MNDLPTRKEVRDRMASHNNGGWRIAGLEIQILRAYAEGRLIDRDTIDYEAATAKLIEQGPSDFRDDAVAYNIVIAALGIGGNNE